MAITPSMTLSQITVPYSELSGDDAGVVIEENISYQAGDAVKAFKVAWSDRWRFVLQAMTTVKTASVGSGAATVSFQAPLQYPDFPGLYCNSINMRGFGNFTAGPPLAYEWCILTCTFRTVPWQFDGTLDNGTSPFPYATIGCEFGSQTLQLPASAFHFQSNTNMPATRPVPYVVPTMNLSVQQHFCPYIPVSAMFGLVGKVNSAAFYGIDPGYVLYLGASSNSDFSIADSSSWTISQTITHKFSARSIPWNQYMKPDGSGFDYLVYANGGGYIYDSGDLNSLFFYGSGSTPGF